MVSKNYSNKNTIKLSEQPFQLGTKIVVVCASFNYIRFEVFYEVNTEQVFHT